MSREGGEGTAAILEVDGKQYECMDCFGYGAGPYPKVGDTFDSEFTGLCATSKSGDALIADNPGKVKKLVSLGRWSYQALGEVVATEPWTLLDCGVAVLGLSRAITDPASVGRFVSIEIKRLDGWRKRAA